MKRISELNAADFGQATAALKIPAVVDFYAPWCGPCKMIGPLLEKLAEHFAGRVGFYKVNVDDAPALAERFTITGVPTLLFFADGELRDKVVGFASPRDLVTRLEALAANAREAQP